MCLSPTHGQFVAGRALSSCSQHPWVDCPQCGDTALFFLLTPKWTLPPWALGAHIDGQIKALCPLRSGAVQRVLKVVLQALLPTPTGLSVVGLKYAYCLQEERAERQEVDGFSQGSSLDAMRSQGRVSLSFSRLTGALKCDPEHFPRGKVLSMLHLCH